MFAWPFADVVVSCSADATPLRAVRSGAGVTNLLLKVKHRIGRSRAAAQSIRSLRLLRNTAVHREVEMVRIDSRTAAWSAAALGVIAALMITAPSALAEPDDPTPPPPYDTATQAVTGDLPTTASGVPHLMSPENLPPGTTDAPVGPQQGPRMSYLRYLWDAISTQNLSKGDALLLLMQRPLDPNAVPPPGLPAGPQQPLPAEPLPPTP